MPQRSPPVTSREANRRPTVMIRIPLAVARRIDLQLEEGTYSNRSDWCRAAIIRRLEEAEKKAP